MKSSIKILRKIRTKMRKTKLEVNGNKPGIQFEEIIYDDNMMGDQLLGHPIMIEMENNLHKG